jgi:PAS domain S-box-containing protein
MESATYDAIISDYQMPEMDGIKFLKQIRSSGNSIPFILFTGRGREEVVIEAINSGADFYLQKGGDPNAQFAELSYKLKIAVERKRAVNALKQDEIRLKTLGTFYQMISAPLKELMIFAVEKSVEITSSSIGYLAFVAEDESLLTMYAWSSLAMKECHIEKKPIEYPLHATGLWGEAVRQRRPVITNDYAAENPLKKGYPNGHVPVIRHMNIPVFDGTRIVMVAGVGNKPSDYDEWDVYELSILMSGLWNVIKQRKAEEELRKKNEELNASYEKIAATEKELRSNLDELIRQEQAVQESEEKYHSVINNIQDMFYRSDRLGNLIMASPSCLKTLGYESFDEILNKPISETFYYFPEQRKELLLLLDEKGSVEDYEVPLKRRDGSIIWTSTNSHYYRDGTGAIAGVEGIFRDITRRKSDEEALKRDAAQLDQIINLVPHMIFATDPAGNFLLVNRAVAQSYNTSVVEIVGKPQADFQKDAAELQHMLDDNREVLTSGTSKFIPEETFTDSLGKKRYLQTTKVPFTTLGNNQKAVLGVAIDITERKIIEEELLKKNEGLAASYEQLTAAEEELRSNFDELIQREQALKASEERYRNVVETQTEFISRCQPDSTHVFVNEAYSRYYGMKRDEIIGHRFHPDIPVEDKERVKQFFASLTPDHPVDVIEHRVIMPDGTLRWQQWTDRAIFDSSGKVTEYQSVGQDVTARKLEEQALHENEQRLTSIYNTVGDSIFQLTVEPHEQYRFTSVNSAFSRTTGLPSGQVIGKKANEIIPEPSLLLVLGKYRQAIEEKAIVRWEETSHYPSGQLTGEVSIAPIFDQAGNCTYLIGSVHDITERKHAEEELRERNSQMRALIDNLPFDTWAMDRSGQYILQNPVSIKNWGDCIGKTPSQIHLRKDLLEKWQENNRKAFEGTVVRGELSVSSENGVRIFDEIIAPVRVGNVINGIIGVNIDITERKQADVAQLLTTKTLKLLTSITRHDINNQLAIIRGHIALLEKKQSDTSSNEHFKKVQASAQTISSMIQFTKEYESIGVNAPAWQDCRTLIETAAKQFSLANIRLENDIPAGTGLFADPLIVRVFYNLMDNAVRYGETITTIRFSLQKSGADLVILCEDDGNGIPADEKEKIFDRGFGKNTGLGLFLSREILSITGIKIQETGEPGRGARFEIIVPQGSFCIQG